MLERRVRRKNLPFQIGERYACWPTSRKRLASAARIFVGHHGCVASWNGETGFIHDAVERRLANHLDNFAFYFAGPPPMTQALQEMLMVKNRVPFGQVHFDRFFDKRMLIRVKQGKGSKERYAMLSPQLLEALRARRHRPDGSRAPHAGRGAYGVRA